MNARKLLNGRVSLTATALALSGALVMSAMMTSCAGNSDDGPSGSGGAGGSGGGGSGGGNMASDTCTDPASNAVTFCNGKAQGVMTGYAFIALGKADTATDPKCAEDPKTPSVTRQISSADNTPSGACPTTGTTVWKTAGSLCISGSIPMVVGGDYKSNWGLQIGVNTIDPPATAVGAGTLGKNYSTITLNTTGTVTPTNTAIRAMIHVVNMAPTPKNLENNPYCATMVSGKAITLTSFNTACWDNSGDYLTAADIPNIDKIGVQISSDELKAYTATDFCLTGIQFGN